MQAPFARPLLPSPHMCKETSGLGVGFELVDHRVLKHEMGSYFMRVMNGAVVQTAGADRVSLISGQAKGRNG